MKRFLTIVFIAAGLSFTNTAKAQTAPPAKGSADTTQSNKKVEADKASPSSGSDITIDESGAPKPKNKKKGNNAKSAPKQEESSGGANRSAEQSAPSPAPAPGGIAIDEGGTSKPKQRPKAHTETIAPPNKNDSTIVAPANQVGRPE